MVQIEVDDDIFRFLQERATPLLDTPNSVLRRLLLGEANQRSEGVEQKPVREVRRQAEEQMVEVFVRAALAKLFGGEFLKVSPYRLMYESGKRLIYFQNFNKKGSPKLWY